MDLHVSNNVRLLYVTVIVFTVQSPLPPLQSSSIKTCDRKKILLFHTVVVCHPNEETAISTIQ